MSLNVGREHFNGVKDRQKAVVYRQEPDYTGVTQYPYGTEVELWYRDATADEIDQMIKDFKVDSSKIIINSSPDESILTDDEGYQW